MASCSRGVRGTAFRLRLGSRRWTSKFHASASRFRESDGNRLLGRSRAVLAFTNVVHLFADEFASLRRWRLSSALVLTGSLHSGLLGHKQPSILLSERNSNATRHDSPEG
jgi:hypothetical protein